MISRKKEKTPKVNKKNGRGPYVTIESSALKVRMQKSKNRGKVSHHVQERSEAVPAPADAK